MLVLVEEKLKILSEPTLKFFKSKPKIFEIDLRKAGAVAKAIQSRLAPKVISKKDARLTLNIKRGGQQSSNCHGKSADYSATRQFNSRIFVNSSHHDTTGVDRDNTETHKVSVRQAKECSKDSTRKVSNSRSQSMVTLGDELELVEGHDY